MAELQHFLNGLIFLQEYEKGIAVNDHQELTLAATVSTVDAHEGGGVSKH